MYEGSDVSVCKMLYELVPAVGTDHILMPYGMGVPSFLRQCNVLMMQAAAIDLCQPPPE